MELVLDIQTKKDLKENDIIVFKDGKWMIMSKSSFLADYVKKHNDDMKVIEDENKELKNQIIKLQNDLVALAKIVKEK